MNENLLVTAAEAATVFTLQRGTTVSRHMIHNWVTRYEVQTRDKYGTRGAARYRFGDLMEAERRARINDSGGGRGRTLAA